MYEDDLYRQLQNIPGKRYHEVTVEAQARAGLLLEQYGANPFGGQPATDYFENMAEAQIAGMTIVSSGRGLRQYEKIAARCGGAVSSIEDFDL